MHDADRGKARKKRMQKMEDDVEMGFKDTGAGEGEMSPYRECWSEEFEGVKGLGVHFVDVNLSK